MGSSVFLPIFPDVVPTNKAISSYVLCTSIFTNRYCGILFFVQSFLDEMTIRVEVVLLCEVQLRPPCRTILVAPSCRLSMNNFTFRLLAANIAAASDYLP